MTPFDAQTQRMIERRKHRRSALPPGALLSFSPIAAPTDAALETEGDGLIIDLSRGGCRVNSETAIVMEQPYSLIIQLPNFPQPVTVESAIARWKGKQMFGVMFIAMRREQERSLCEFLENLPADAP